MVEATENIIGNKITNKITKVSRNSQQNSSEIVESKTKIQDLIKKYLKKDIYLQRIDRKLLMIFNY